MKKLFVLSVAILSLSATVAVVAAEQRDINNHGIPRPKLVGGKYFSKFTCLKGNSPEIQIEFDRFYSEAKHAFYKMKLVHPMFGEEGLMLGQRMVCMASVTDRRILLCYGDSSLQSRAGVNSYGQTEYQLEIGSKVLSKLGYEKLSDLGFALAADGKVSLNIPFINQKHVIDPKDPSFDGYCDFE